MAAGADAPLIAAKKFGRLAHNLATLEKATLEQAAKSVKHSVQTQMAVAGVRNNKLRGVGKNGARVGVRYDFISSGRVLLRATGPFHLIERNTKKHRIPRENEGRRARARAVFIPTVGPRAYANHPGTRGKHPWAKGTAPAPLLAENAGKAALHQAVTSVFR